MRRCTKTLGGIFGASLLALTWNATAEAASNFLITPPIPATGSCRVICSVVNLTSQTQAIMGVVVHDATNAEVSSACPNIPDGAACSTTTTARSIGKSPFYCMFSTDPGPVASTLGSICVECGTATATRSKTCLPASSPAGP
jgi:hypothetical protein